MLRVEAMFAPAEELSIALRYALHVAARSLPMVARHISRLMYAVCFSRYDDDVATLLLR